MGRKILETLTESMFYVLMALLRQARCGTEIAEYISAVTQSRVRLGPGTLYTILAKFEEVGLIRETAVEGRKRTYASVSYTHLDKHLVSFLFAAPLTASQ